MTNYLLTTIVTLLSVILMFWLGAKVGIARGTYGVKAPATTGHEMFDRAFRIQMNTIESVLMFMPALWLCAAWLSDSVAGGLGLLWLIGRVLYAITYQRDPASRSTGFGMGMGSTVLLLLATLWGVGKYLLA